MAQTHYQRSLFFVCFYYTTCLITTISRGRAFSPLHILLLHELRQVYPWWGEISCELLKSIVQEDFSQIHGSGKQSLCLDHFQSYSPEFHNILHDTEQLKSPIDFKASKSHHRNQYTSTDNSTRKPNQDTNSVSEGMETWFSKFKTWKLQLCFCEGHCSVI